MAIFGFVNGANSKAKEAEKIVAEKNELMTRLDSSRPLFEKVLKNLNEKYDKRKDYYGISIFHNDEELMCCQVQGLIEVKLDNFDYEKYRAEVANFLFSIPDRVECHGHPLSIVPLLPIKYDEVAYFTMIGDVQYTTEVSGGEVKVSGGGSSIGGAVVGGIIGGGVGAIIGSRKAVTSESNGIHSETIKHDNRQTLIKYVDGREQRHGKEWYSRFMDIMPKKEKSYIEFNREKDSADLEKLKLLKDMLDQGLINEEEFKAKKEALL